MPRPRSFRPHAENPVNLWGASTVVDGVAFTPSLEPGPEREAAMVELRRGLADRVRGLDAAAEELLALLAAHEPTEFLAAIAIPTSVSFDPSGRRPDDATEMVMWPAKIEYLVGLAMATGEGSGSTPSEVTARAMALVDDIVDSVLAKQMTDSFDAPVQGNDGLDSAVFMLRHEHIFDRMPGFAAHLQEIDAEVFGRHRDFYVDALGFSPADVVRVVRTRVAADGRRVEDGVMRARRLHTTDPELSAVAVAEALHALDASRRWVIPSLSEDTGVAESELASMLSFFSARLASQPAFRLPTDRNLARTRPCIALETGDYFIADPWALMGAVHLRLAEEAIAEPDGPMKRYRRHREDGHQRLTGGVFMQVFGEDFVWEEQHYVGREGPGEVDVLVTVDWPLVVEAKAHSLTDQGRRGAPLRVNRVADDAIEAALTQTRRARAYVEDEAARPFAARQGGLAVERLPGSVRGVTEVVVMFERMDPLALHGPELVGQDGREVWIVCLADLLMVRDILRGPAEVHHYARVRAAMAACGPSVFMESDALGAYLVDRIGPPRAAAERDPEAAVFIGYESELINEYFTLMELGRPIDPPTSGVPEPVSSALAAVVPTAACWSQAVDAVMDADARTWRRWRSFARRHARAEFGLSDSVRLCLGAPSLSCLGDGVLLTVPSRR